MSDAAVHSLDHFTLAVPDLGEAERFYTLFGLDVRRVDTGLELRAFGDDHLWATLAAGPAKRLVAIRLGAFADDLPALAARSRAYGIEGRADTAQNFWRHYDGLDIEIADAPKTSPDEKSTFGLPARFNGWRGVGSRADVATVRPRRLAHLAIFTSDVLKAVAFYDEMFGLKLSDRSGENVAFIHGAHGSDHHLLALARSQGPGLHHSSWDVGSIDEVGLGAMQMARAGYAAGWGLGRHVLGSNYFHYVRDPWGSYAEYSADMDYVPKGSVWPAGDHPGEDARYQWGPGTPADFGRNYELAPADHPSGLIL